jgi:hypothetical protein
MLPGPWLRHPVAAVDRPVDPIIGEDASVPAREAGQVGGRDWRSGSGGKKTRMERKAAVAVGYDALVGKIPAAILVL